MATLATSWLITMASPTRRLRSPRLVPPRGDQAYVRFTPASGQIADTWDVRFVPIADIASRGLARRMQRGRPRHALPDIYESSPLAANFALRGSRASDLRILLPREPFGLPSAVTG